IRHRFDPSQGMVARNTGLDRKQRQHTCLSVLCPAHQRLQRYIGRHINKRGDFQSGKISQTRSFSAACSSFFGGIWRGGKKTSGVTIFALALWSFLTTTFSYSASTACLIMFRVSASTGKAISQWVPSLSFSVGNEMKRPLGASMTLMHR